MRKTTFILFALVSLMGNAQNLTQFRINNQQKAALLRAVESGVIILETNLDDNNNKLSNQKKDNVPDLNDIMPLLESLREKSTKNSKIYKDICFDCYESEYKDQLKRLERFGLTITEGYEVTVMPLLIDQDSVSILRACEMILSESKSEYSYHTTKIIGNLTTRGILFLDESTRGSKERYVTFVIHENNTGNQDLETPGKINYSLDIVSGKFLDFAGFWIKYINPKITIEELSKNGDTYTHLINGRKRDIRLVKNNYENRWSLINH